MFKNTTHPPTSNSRRAFLKTTGGAVVGSALAASVINRVHAGEDNTIRLALIGCGGRGGGAVANALSTSGGPVNLHAMADVFEDKLLRSHRALSDQFPGQVDVPTERQFFGFDPSASAGNRRSSSTGRYMRWTRACTCSWRNRLLPIPPAWSACYGPESELSKRT
jgi:hypothetical protein